MASIIKDLQSEISYFLKGSTIDAIVPPTIYVVFNQITTINIAGLSAIFIAVIILIRRKLKNQTMKYGFLGLAGVLFAFGIAVVTNRASNFFIPQLLSSGLIIILIVISLVAGKPFAAWLSHISRGWSFDWFLRPDVKPAYTEVTWVWLLFMFIKLSIQFILWQSDDITSLFFINTLLGLPGITVVLIGTYVYGIFRLHKLKGPGVHEYLKPGPYEGQKKGF